MCSSLGYDSILSRKISEQTLKSCLGRKRSSLFGLMASDSEKSVFLTLTTSQCYKIIFLHW
jgi:hypothetical protein